MISNFKKQGRKAAMKYGERWNDICKTMKARRDAEVLTQIQEAQLIGKENQLKESQITQRQNSTGGTRDESIVMAIRKNGLHNLFWAIAMIIASLASTVYVFQPFQVGPIIFFMVLGFVGVTIASIHIALKSYHEGKWLNFGISSICVMLTICSHIYLAVIRGEIFKKIFENSDSFYDSSINLLRIGLALLSVAVEVGAGIFLHIALESLWGVDVQDYRNLKRCRKRMRWASTRIEYLKTLPQIEMSAFVEGAIEGEEEMKRRQNNNQNRDKLKALIIPFIILLIIILTMFSTAVFAEVTENTTVTVIDLSRSSSNRGYHGEITFKKNLTGVENVIKEIEPDSRLIVIGITEKSFSNPLVILDSTIPREPGFFKEKIKVAREKLLKEWKDRSKNLRPIYRKSNIFGAIILAAHLLEGSNNGKLIIFSDLRHYGIGFDLESPNWLSPSPLLERVEQEGLVPRLHGIQVYCLGVTSFGKSPKYFQTLRAFWALYFKKAGAEMKKYSILREL